MNRCRGMLWELPRSSPASIPCSTSRRCRCLVMQLITKCCQGRSQHLSLPFASPLHAHRMLLQVRAETHPTHAEFLRDVQRLLHAGRCVSSPGLCIPPPGTVGSYSSSPHPIPPCRQPGPSWEHIPGGGGCGRKIALPGGKKCRFWC